MVSGFRRWCAVSLFVFLAGSQWLAAQMPVYRPGEYPAPRYPQIKANYTMDELVAMAREVVRRPYQNAFLKAGYNIQPGHRALIVVNGDFDRTVMEAIVRAIQEAGGQADVVMTYGQKRDPNYFAIEHAYREANGILGGGGGAGEGTSAAPGGGFGRATVLRLAENNGYNVLIYGSGGPHDAIKIPWQYVFWDRLDKFVTSAGFPLEVQDALDQAAWDMVTKARRFRARDPEGTDITWTVKPHYWEEAKKTYNFNIVHEGHLSPIPMGMGVDSFMESDAEGVIAGTLNHAGPFQHLRVSINRASFGGVEGGGRYGQLLREALNKWKDVQLPGHPGTGINKLWEVAIGTTPKATRTKSYREEGGSWERARSGIIHWGMGSRTGFVMARLMPEEWNEFNEKSDTPTGHIHIHTYFTTIEVETIDGRKVLLIDKGHLTALDDPKVRQIAAKYGDPDELLREIWIPAMPGINVPGDYMQDYGRDPVSYIKKEIADNYKY